MRSPERSVAHLGAIFGDVDASDRAREVREACPEVLENGVTGGLQSSRRHLTQF